MCMRRTITEIRLFILQLSQARVKWYRYWYMPGRILLPRLVSVGYPSTRQALRTNRLLLQFFGPMDRVVHPGTLVVMHLVNSWVFLHVLWNFTITWMRRCSMEVWIHMLSPVLDNFNTSAISVPTWRKTLRNENMQRLLTIKSSTTVKKRRDFRKVCVIWLSEAVKSIQRMGRIVKPFLSFDFINSIFQNRSHVYFPYKIRYRALFLSRTHFQAHIFTLISCALLSLFVTATRRKQRNNTAQSPDVLECVWPWGNFASDSRRCFHRKTFCPKTMRDPRVLQHTLPLSLHHTTGNGKPRMRVRLSIRLFLSLQLHQLHQALPNRRPYLRRTPVHNVKVYTRRGAFHSPALAVNNQPDLQIEFRTIWSVELY